MKLNIFGDQFSLANVSMDLSLVDCFVPIKCLYNFIQVRINMKIRIIIIVSCISMNICTYRHSCLLHRCHHTVLRHLTILFFLLSTISLRITVFIYSNNHKWSPEINKILLIDCDNINPFRKALNDTLQTHESLLKFG